MKKTSKVFGAVALSAALAMGCVPAFAATPTAGSASDVATVDDATTGTDANTAIDVSTYVSQISVALPMTLPVYANVGGGEGISPDNYYIENLSRTNIKLATMSWEVTSEQQADWNLGRTVASLTTDSAANVPNGGSAPNMGSLGFVMTPRGASETITVGSKTYSQDGAGNEVNIQAKSASDAFSGAAAGIDWTIKGATNTAMGSGAKLLLKVDTYSSSLSRMLTSPAEDVVKVVYTVAAQTDADA